MATCTRAGCASGKPAVWFPTLLIYAHRRHEPARARCGLPTCEDYRPTITLDDLITDRGWAIIVAGFRASGHAAPDRALTVLDWDLVAPGVDPLGPASMMAGRPGRPQ